MLLFVHLFVALVLDAALTANVPECASKLNPTLCHLLLWSHELTEALGDILHGNCSLEEVKEGASYANKAVTKALNTADKKSVLSALKEALHVENAVLFHLKSRGEETGSCKGALLSFMHSVYSLVRAISHVVEETKKNAVQKILETFRNGVESGSGNLTEQVYGMATQVLAII